MMLGLALFDLDRTLTDRDLMFRAWAASFVARHGLPNEAAELLVAQDADGLGDKHEMFTAVMEQFGTHLDVASEVEAFYADMTARHRVTDEVRVALQRLRAAGWRIGIVTNGSPNQLAKIEVAGLDALVDGVAVSGVEGVRKPERELFAIAASRAGGDLEGGWMVGDNPDADIRGGAHAGMITVWLPLGRSWPLTDLHPDHTAASAPDAIALMLEQPARR